MANIHPCSINRHTSRLPRNRCTLVPSRPLDRYVHKTPTVLVYYPKPAVVLKLLRYPHNCPDYNIDTRQMSRQQLRITLPANQKNHGLLLYLVDSIDIIKKRSNFVWGTITQKAFHGRSHVITVPARRNTTMRSQSELTMFMHESPPIEVVS